MGKSVVVLFIGYIHEPNVEEDMLLCKLLPSKTSDEEIFQRTGLFLGGII